MAPEILKGKKYDNEADVFSAGVILFIMLAGFPPFQFATKQDWWFDKLMTKKYKLFWKAHCRNAEFSDDAKDLIVKLLTADPKDRITIDQILENDWFSGEILSDEELTVELDKRRKIVDKSKKEQRAQAAQEKGAADVQYEERVDRSVDEDGDELPVGAPVIQFGGAFGRKNDMAGDDDDFDLNDEAFSSTQAVASGVPLYVADDHVNVYTSFMSNESAATIMTILADLFKAASCRLTKDMENYKIKANFLNEEGAIAFAVNVYETEDQEKRVVIFKRRQGDPLQFHDLFEELMNELVDIVSYDEEEEEETEE